MSKEELNVMLTPQQVEALARPLVWMVDRISAFYDDPENERAFQEWYLKNYG